LVFGVSTAFSLFDVPAVLLLVASHFFTQAAFSATHFSGLLVLNRLHFACAKLQCMQLVCATAGVLEPTCANTRANAAIANIENTLRNIASLGFFVIQRVNQTGHGCVKHSLLSDSHAVRRLVQNTAT
jgi:hypothetical protein